jgi:hypothetical protein
MIATHSHKGWYFPRSLPHFDSPHLPQFVTFRLGDSLPAHTAEARPGETAAVHRRRVHKALDAGAGVCWLSRPEFAAIACEGIVHGSGQTHDLHAFVVMPNHVHVLTSLRAGYRLCDVVRGWKSFSARRINALLDRRGPLWQRDYFDRFVRNEAHFFRVRAYIENNPVTAGLTDRADRWPFRSVGVHADVGVDADAPVFRETPTSAILLP